MMQDAKQELRLAMRAKKRLLSDGERNAAAERLFEQVENAPFFQKARCIACYAALPDEVPTMAFLEKWRGEKVFLLPIVEGERMRFVEYSGEEALQKGAFGILEPTGANAECGMQHAELVRELSTRVVGSQSAQSQFRVDCILVPGVAFDQKGNRMGRGKGYYDRFLCQTYIYKVGICFDFQLLECIPSEETDIPMDEIITESRHLQVSLREQNH